MHHQPIHTLPLSRKRSAARSPSPDGDEQQDEGLEHLKRNKTDGDLESLGVVSPEQGWHFDVEDVLNSSQQRPHNGSYQSIPGGTVIDRSTYDVERSIFLLCTVGEMRVHYDALVQSLPSLVRISPNLQTFAVTIPSCTILSQTSSGPLRPTLSTIEVSGRSASTFLKLGLLHPLGGGQQPLDAIVAIDTNKRRRLVVPFGWGAGRHVRDPAGGRIVVERLMAVLEDGVRLLERERVGMCS